MRYFIFLAVILVASVSAFGQKTAPKSAKATKPVAKFTREKFDPARDPNVDLSAAVEIASKTGKRIILDVGGEWCGWCVYMDKFFYQNPKLNKLRDSNFVWMKVNMSDENENIPFLASYPEINSYPHLFVLDSTGKLLHTQPTEPLEAGKGYNLSEFTNFLKRWSPVKK